ncbi:MAG TPA: inositol monophosphatase family protein [Acidocella sp.]|jgi:fructose-1,6-bisphosphatase/inositol monophosphatase family enzyme|uniref:inositol monophosphatase family protein n=1 Tax=Acidocella sp. TaxID=50710 RepID=UPI002C721DA2|nr:inositol monophosphatase family protein [Acidocella sp.]HVE20876.1 inositol monophosphatase family protein [Acidocella sp.]
MTDQDTHEVIALLRAVAQAEIMPRFRRLGLEDVRTKSGPLDPVTVADEAAERALTAGFKKLFPGDDVLGEEAASADPELLQRLARPGRVWVIDPIDGTANYAAELPLFGVMAALVEADKVLASFIHDPLGDDTAVALAGGGAWTVARDGTRRRLKVAAPVPVGEMVGSLSWRYFTEPRRSRVLSRLDRLASVTDYRCAAHQYRMLAGGHSHVQMFGKLMPWDHAAGVLLHQEAGGYGRHFDGSPYTPSNFYGGLLLTPDEASWHAFDEAILR